VANVNAASAHFLSDFFSLLLSSDWPFDVTKITQFLRTFLLSFLRFLFLSAFSLIFFPFRNVQGTAQMLPRRTHGCKYAAMTVQMCRIRTLWRTRRQCKRWKLERRAVRSSIFRRRMWDMFQTMMTHHLDPKPRRCAQRFSRVVAGDECVVRPPSRELLGAYVCLRELRVL
jgi:hypothetical protein